MISLDFYILLTTWKNPPKFTGEDSILADLNHTKRTISSIAHGLRPKSIVLSGNRIYSKVLLSKAICRSQYYHSLVKMHVCWTVSQRLTQNYIFLVKWINCTSSADTLTFLKFFIWLLIRFSLAYTDCDYNR